MTHFGLSCPTSSGHLNPMTTLGHELQQRGHRVTVIGLPDAATQARAAGLEFRAIAAAQFPPGASAQFTAELGQLSGLAAFRYTVALFQQFTTTLLNEAPAIIEPARIAALLIDGLPPVGIVPNIRHRFQAGEWHSGWRIPRQEFVGDCIHRAIQ